ncbi:YgdI/YgdR family lipoprotein [Aquipseudomonas ullengensis]|uniref:YgdI/YgdR family lipoprotein n=1 Tax=Aquipseudomonas ullengensis TaxID=2759166 RepID=A0A7W4LNS4_9GAMM|nr:YgdI/YgdR family lipoprotein [Pseudomonas ullengensis]MBB2496569.1 YgdI/YgdR family lipoprotein [Pseudomonas ullengensis]
MKHWIIAGLCVIGLSGCATDYLIATTDGQMLSAEDKPELDEETGLIQYEDAEGNDQQIPQNMVKQIIER